MCRLIPLLLAAALSAPAADFNQDLLDAARRGDLAAVKASLEKGAALETKTPYGQTPLYVAAMNGHEDVARFLLDQGASPDVRDTFYKAPMLGFVMQRKHYAIAKLLIAKSAGPVDQLLSSAAQSGSAELVAAVLDKGKPSQAALDKTYETALDTRQAVVAEALKKAGAHEPAPAVEVDPKLLESYTGTYKTEAFPFDIKVSVQDGKLFFQAAGQGQFAPKAKSPTLFEFAPAQITVEFDAPGAFSLKQGGMGPFKFKRVVAQ